MVQMDQLSVMDWLDTDESWEKPAEEPPREEFWVLNNNKAVHTQVQQSLCACQEQKRVSEEGEEVDKNRPHSVQFAHHCE